MTEIVQGYEFDCIECGRHIVRIVHLVGDPDLCGECKHMPGWLDNPELRKLLDPGGDTNPPDLSKAPSWPETKP